MTTATGRSDLAGRLSHSFRDPALLDHALAHRSWCAENLGYSSNERLEFLGDAVLGLAVADYLFHTFPDLPEGDLARVRSAVVNSTTLAELAQGLGVGKAIRLGKGEAASGGAGKSSILADSMEAIIGAVYLDAGWDAASRFVVDLCRERADEAAEGPGGEDFKTRLQEYTAQKIGAGPTYDVTSSGPDHEKIFTATVSIGVDACGVGVGGSKKEAQQAAARHAWNAIHSTRADVHAN